MKFIIYRSSQPNLEKPTVIGTCNSFSTSSPDCFSCDNVLPVTSSVEIASLDIGNIRFEGDPRPWKCQDIEVKRAEATTTKCRPYYIKTY